MGQASLDDIVSNQGPAAAPAALAATPAPVSGTAHIDDIVSNQGAASSTPPAPGTTGVAGALNKFGEWGAGVAPGMVESMGETIQSLPWVGKKIISPEAMQAERAYFAPGTEAEKFGQTTGHIAEPILEFVLGDEALKGVALAEKLGIASKIAKITQDSPYIGKLLQHGVNAARMGTVGAVEAAAKGATPGKAVATGVMTGLGGEVLNTAIEAAPEAIQAIKTLQNPFSKAASAARAASTSEPGFIQQVVQGEQVAQAPAQAATRAAAKAAGSEVGLSTVQPAGLRTLAEEPISVVNGLKKSVYSQVDQAAGTDIKTLYDKLDAISDKIDLEASGSPEEARLEARRTSQMETIEDAKAAARAKGVDVDKMLAKGDALHTREMALRDFQKGFLKNVNIVPGNVASGTPETITLDSAIRAAQKLQDNTKFGAPRLEQALGKAGAKQFLDDLYAAQRAGVKAVNLQDMIAKTLRGLEIAGAASGMGLGAYELATH